MASNMIERSIIFLYHGLIFFVKRLPGCDPLLTDTANGKAIAIEC